MDEGGLLREKEEKILIRWIDSLGIVTGGADGLVSSLQSFYGRLLTSGEAGIDEVSRHRRLNWKRTNGASQSTITG